MWTARALAVVTVGSLGACGRSTPALPAAGASPRELPELTDTPP